MSQHRSARHDDLLARWLPVERPAGFNYLPPGERAWRGRVFLMCWAWTRSAAYAWALAGTDERAQVAAWRTLVEETADARIDEAMQLTAGERHEMWWFDLEAQGPQGTAAKP